MIENYNDNEICQIRLSRSENIGPIIFSRLINVFGNAETALKNVANLSVRGGLKNPIKIYPEKLVLDEINFCNKINARIITITSDIYPSLLKQIADPPPTITIRGNEELLNRNIISIVGPRNPSINGRKFSEQIASNLGRNNIVISSGLARGIDTHAHIGSIKTGTIAVIAGGIDNIYPRENEELYHRIAKDGLIISENPFGSLPKGGNFPRRNRIISGISLGVVVVEATLRSGTLITARFALEQNREIFAVPGSPFDPRCQGTNRLIKNGAKLIENVDDILEEIKDIKINMSRLDFSEKDDVKFDGFKEKMPTDDEINDARKNIIDNIGYSGTSFEEIISFLQIPSRIVNIALIQLELAGIIENKHNKIILCK